MSNFTLLGCLEVVDLWLETKQNKKQQQQFHGFNGFLSLQLGLSFELGLRLRLTKMFIVEAFMYFWVCTAVIGVGMSINISYMMLIVSIKNNE